MKDAALSALPQICLSSWKAGPVKSGSKVTVLGGTQVEEAFVVGDNRITLSVWGTYLRYFEMFDGGILDLNQL